MFPTPVGMNQNTLRQTGDILHVPHTRGDEPFGYAIQFYVRICSPHPWG